MNFKDNSELPCCTSEILWETQQHSTQEYDQYQHSCLQYQGFSMTVQFLLFILKLHKHKKLNYLYNPISIKVTKIK